MLEALKFLKKNLHSTKPELINDYQSLNSSQQGRVTAVDGGCCIIADGGSWLISKIRVASVHYDNGRRMSKLEKRQDHYYTIIKDSQSLEHSLPELRSDFKNIRELTEAPSIIMRTLEFKHALELIKELPKNSLLLIDGLLRTETPDQEKFLGILEHESKKQDINVLGIAKTFRQSINGRSIIGALINERPDSKWIYSLKDFHIIRLHEQASHAYAVNSFKHTKLTEVLPVLSYYSTDPALIGYPYPLLKVDKDARINSHERATEINKLKIICKREGLDFIEYDQKSTNMHSIMDKQKYR